VAYYLNCIAYSDLVVTHLNENENESHLKKILDICMWYVLLEEWICIEYKFQVIPTI